MSDLDGRLDELRARGVYRRMRLVSGPQGPRVLLDGHPMLLLCSNNYLGYADHPRVREAAADAAMRWGAGAGASRLVSGNMTVHRRLEERLAEFEGADRCLLFGSGYLANTGVISALAQKGEVVFSDELNHASIVDGCRLARAETFVYRHADLEHLEWGLRQAAGRASLVVTDSVFSMDGDLAPLEGLVALAGRHDARLMVDEAHATGALGPGGRGAVAAAGLEEEVDVIVGTLGKALGSYGAYVCCDQATARYLVNTARTLIFSTALPLRPRPPRSLPSTSWSSIPSVSIGCAATRACCARPWPRRASNARPRRVTSFRSWWDPRPRLPRRVRARSSKGCSRRPSGPRPSPRAPRDCGSPSWPPTPAPSCGGQRASWPLLRNRVRTCRASAEAGRTDSTASRSARAPIAAAIALRTRCPRPPRTSSRSPARVRRLAGRASAGLPVLPLVRGLFVTGTGTGVGKTVVAAAILTGLAARGERCAAFKPVITGLDDPSGEWPPDHELLAAAAGGRQTPEEVCPHRFGPAASPHLAAEQAGKALDPDALLAAARGAAAGADALVCEGAGGLLVPLADRFLVRDLAAALALPLVVAARPGLGTINHTLLTLEAARAAGLAVAAVVLTPGRQDPRPSSGRTGRPSPASAPRRSAPWPVPHPAGWRQRVRACPSDAGSGTGEAACSSGDLLSGRRTLGRPAKMLRARKRWPYLP
ncbi:MAG: dethiobiotin synthase [Thermoleophilaceae bacterium]